MGRGTRKRKQKYEFCKKKRCVFYKKFKLIRKYVILKRTSYKNNRSKVLVGMYKLEPFLKRL